MVRMRKGNTLNDRIDFNTPGMAPHGLQFLRGTTYINLVQFIILNKNTLSLRSSGFTLSRTGMPRHP